MLSCDKTVVIELQRQTITLVSRSMAVKTKDIQIDQF